MQLTSPRHPGKTFLVLWMENRSENSKAYAQAGKSALWVWSDGDATRPPRTRREIALSENSKQKSSQKSQSFVGLLLSLEFIPSNWQTGNWQTGQTASRLSGHDWQCRFGVEFQTVCYAVAKDGCRHSFPCENWKLCFSFFFYLLKL